MANPSPVTMPAFEVVEGFLYVLKLGTTVLGQCSKIQAQSQIPTRKMPRLGDTTKKVVRSPVESSINLTIYAEKDPDQLGKILGVSKPGTGGWLANTKLELNPSIAPYDLTIEVYATATGTSDTLAGIWTAKNFTPTSLNLPIQSDSVVEHQINGECDNLYYIPSTGYGA